MSSMASASAYRKRAVAVGVLFIIGTAAGIISGALTEPVMGDP